MGLQGKIGGCTRAKSFVSYRSCWGKSNEVQRRASGIVFPGQYYDSETGLHYNYFRYYDPETGRYLTSEPIGVLGGSNTYLYSIGNPITYYDIYGLISDCLVCIVNCNIAFKGAEGDRLDQLISSNNKCSIKGRRAAGNCIIGAMGTDIGLKFFNRGRLQKCLKGCSENECEENTPCSQTK
jgi:RHS repeat-associated protein